MSTVTRKDALRRIRDVQEMLTAKEFDVDSAAERYGYRMHREGNPRRKLDIPHSVGFEALYEHPNASVCEGRNASLSICLGMRPVGLDPDLGDDLDILENGDDYIFPDFPEKEGPSIPHDPPYITMFAKYHLIFNGNGQPILLMNPVQPVFVPTFLADTVKADLLKKYNDAGKTGSRYRHEIKFRTTRFGDETNESISTFRHSDRDHVFCLLASEIAHQLDIDKPSMIKPDLYVGWSMNISKKYWKLSDYFHSSYSSVNELGLDDLVKIAAGREVSYWQPLFNPLTCVAEACISI